MLHFCVCEHRADVIWQKAPALCYFSKGHSPTSFVGCQYAFWQILLSLFLWFALSSGVLIRHLPLSSLWLTQWQMMRSDADVTWPWSSPRISLEVVLSSLVTVCIIYLFNLSSIFSTDISLNFWEFKLLNNQDALPLICLSIIVFLISWDRQLLS